MHQISTIYYVMCLSQFDPLSAPAALKVMERLRKDTWACHVGCHHSTQSVGVITGKIEQKVVTGLNYDAKKMIRTKKQKIDKLDQLKLEQERFALSPCAGLEFTNQSLFQ